MKIRPRLRGFYSLALWPRAPCELPRKIGYRNGIFASLILIGCRYPAHRQYKRLLPCGYLEGLPIRFWCVELTEFFNFVSSTRITWVVACRLL